MLVAAEEDAGVEAVDVGEGEVLAGWACVLLFFFVFLKDEHDQLQIKLSSNINTNLNCLVSN